MATYADVVLLVENAAFLGAVKVALVDAAVDILVESIETPFYDARRALAVRVLRDPAADVTRVAWGVAVNPTIQAAAPAVPADVDIQFTVNSLWNSLAVV